MFYSTTFLAFAILQTVSAHTVFTTLFIDDVNQGDATCVRMPKDGATSTAPLIDLSSNNMACGVDGATGVAMVCPAIQGSKLTFLWREYADASQPGAIDISHKGPCSVYMKAVDSAINDPGSGDGWFKVWDYGYDAATNEWCTEKVIKSKGLLSVNIPKDLAGGYYLVRPELLSLHEADKTPAQPQFYAGCAQIFLQSSATGKPSNTVSIPGYVKAGDPSMTFNIYEPKFPYPMYGPPAYGSSTTTSKRRLKARAAPQTQDQGLEPENCVVRNGNWCGIELESYTTDAGCWQQSAICWDQSDVCYKTAAPTGYEGCSAWEAKCHANDDACNAGNHVGPLNKGKILTPKISAVYDLDSAFQGGAKNAQPGSSTGGSTPAGSSPLETPVIETPKGPSLFSSTTSIDDGAKTVFVTVQHTVTVANICDGTRVWARPTGRGSVEPESGVSCIPQSSFAPTPAYTSPFSNVSSGVTSASSGLKATPDNICGGTSGFSCQGPAGGQCCSQYGWCGNTDKYCGKGCQPGFGVCAKVAPELGRRFNMYRRDAADEGSMDVTVTVTTPCARTYGAPIPSHTLFPNTSQISDKPLSQPSSPPSSANNSTGPEMPSCGGTSGKSCTAAGPSYCCSQYGVCGNSIDHCGTGCQVGFGFCDGAVKRAVAQKAKTQRFWARHGDEAHTITVTANTCLDSGMPTGVTLPSISDKLLFTTTITHTQTRTTFVMETATTPLTTTSPTMPLNGLPFTNATSGDLNPSAYNKCGLKVRQTCTGRPEGHCCSEFGYCGETEAHCGAGCQSDFGGCGADHIRMKTGKRNIRQHARW